MLLRAAIVVVVAVTLHLPLVCFSQGDFDERAIRKVIEVWVQAVNSADLPTLLAQFSDDATIDSKIARGKVNKQKYGEAMAAAFRAHDLVGMAAEGIKVTLVDQAHASVLTTIYPMTNARRYVYVLEWRLEKRDGRWVIVETTYKAGAQEPVVWFEVA
jgi:ketosteroid isomerase-like protein